MTDSPGPLITQLQKAPFTWALGRCHWWGILGHQRMSRAARGLSPAPWCGLPTAVLPQGLDTAIRVLSTLHCPGLFPMTSPTEPPCSQGVQCVCFHIQAHGNMPGLRYMLKDCFGKFEMKRNIVKQKGEKIK